MKLAGRIGLKSCRKGNFVSDGCADAPNCANYFRTDASIESPGCAPQTHTVTCRRRRGAGIRAPDLLEFPITLFLRDLLARCACPLSPAGLALWRPLGRRPLSVTTRPSPSEVTQQVLPLRLLGELAKMPCAGLTAAASRGDRDAGRSCRAGRAEGSGAVTPRRVTLPHSGRGFARSPTHTELAAPRATRWTLRALACDDALRRARRL